MDTTASSRLGIALGISVGAHLLFMLCAAALSSDSKPRATVTPPVEITRVAMDGTSLPDGAGQSSFNSPASIASPGFGSKYNLDAGVPTKIPIPPKTQQNNQVQPEQQKPTSQGTHPADPPARQSPPRQSNPQTQNQEFMPPMTSNTDIGNAPPSTPSRASQAGNQNKPRSRGPNRVAFPEFTVEPQVPASMISGGVTNSVDVTVDIAADGTHSERIVRSSGSSHVDDLVLAALKQWRWDPAAREGQAISSTQNFKFTFKPR